jgi:hypothetical protein
MVTMKISRSKQREALDLIKTIETSNSARLRDRATVKWCDIIFISYARKFKEEGC